MKKFLILLLLVPSLSWGEIISSIKNNNWIANSQIDKFDGSKTYSSESLSSDGLVFTFWIEPKKKIESIQLNFSKFVCGKDWGEEVKVRFKIDNNQSQVQFSSLH